MAQLVIINGWRIYAHPLFLDQIARLEQQVERLKSRDPANYAAKNVTKRLVAIKQLAFYIIPEDPTRGIYRLGAALGKGRRHWFRAIFFQQYRLFFRFSTSEKTIIYAWVNDDTTKRAYESQTDAYRVFQKMLEAESPPDSWELLMKEASVAIHRLKTAVAENED